VGEKTPVKVRGIVTAFSEIYQRSAGRGLGQKERFAPLPAVLFIRRLCGRVAGLFTKLSKV